MGSPLPLDQVATIASTPRSQRSLPTSLPARPTSIRAVLFLAVLLGLVQVPGGWAATSAKSDPVQAPGFELPTLNGTVALDSLRGKTVLVDFWASWCTPCRQSFPWLRTLHERFAAQGLVIVAIDLDHDRAAADKFLAAYPAPFVVAFDPEGHTARAFGVTAMPSSYLVGPTGTILSKHIGFDPKKTDEIATKIQEACRR